LEPWYAEQAKERQREHGKTAPGRKSLSQKIDSVKQTDRNNGKGEDGSGGRGKRKTLVKNLTKVSDRNDGKASAQVAKTLRVNRQYACPATPKRRSRRRLALTRQPLRDFYAKLQTCKSA